MIYGRDAFADLRFMDALMDAKRNDNWTNSKGFLADAPQGVGLDEESKLSEDAVEPSASATDAPAADLPPVTSDRSEAVPAEAAPKPPFLGSAVITEDDIDIAEVFDYLDRNALFAGQWMLRKTKEQSRDDYEAMLAEKAEPVLQEWMQR